MMTSTLSQNEKTSLFANPWAWVMWLLGALFYFYEYLLQVSPSVMVSDLMRSFDITATQFGYFAAIYFWMYAPMQIFVGILLDKFGPHRLLTAATGACALGTLMFAVTDHFYITLIGRGLIGLGSAFAIVGCMKIIANWFPPSRFALLLGLVLTVGMSGAIAGQAPLKMMLEHIGDWRRCMYILAGSGIVLMLFMLLVLRDRPDQELTEDHPPEHHEPSILEGLRIILSNRQSWLAAFYGGLMFAPTTLFGLWGIKFISNAYQISEVHAATFSQLIFVGWAIGSPVVGWFADRIKRRLPSMYIGSSVAFLLMTTIIYIPLPHTLLAAALFGFGFFSSGFLGAFPIIKEINPQQYEATSLGFMNMVNMCGGALLPPIMGYILDAYWAGDKINGEPIYSVAAYQSALSVLPAIILISLFFIPFIKETFCKHCYEPKAA